ncbi:MAG: ABC transporter permease [Acidobacteria bacterium]|nr:ABC transporter permease [Acidobacteriota bacterium]
MTRDLKHALRGWRAHPLLAGVACVSLAVGAAGVGALFALVESVFLPTWPVREPASLVRLTLSRSDIPTASSAVSTAVWKRLNESALPFRGMAAVGADRLVVAGDGDARLGDVLFATANVFDVLGTAVGRGRPLTANDDVEGDAAVAVIGHAFWQSAFDGRPDVVGQTVAVEGRALQVVGVADAAFFGIEVGRRFDVMVPLAAEPLLKGNQSRLRNDRAWWLSVVARLSDDVTPGAAAAQVNAAMTGVEIEMGPPSQAAVVFHATPVNEWPSLMRDQYGRPLLLLLGVALLVLLVTGTNAAAAMVARFADRLPEFAVRFSLGATRWQVVRSLLIDTTVLAAISAVLGLGIGLWLASSTVPSLLHATDRGIVPYVPITATWRFVLGGVVLTIASGVLIGVWPALYASRAARLANSVSGAVSARRGRAVIAMVTMQVATAVTLVTVAALLLRSFVELSRQPTAAAPAEVLLVNLSGASTEGLSVARLEELVSRMRDIPGVRAASVATYTPLSGLIQLAKIDVRGFAPRDMRDINASINRVDRGFFDVFGTPLLNGRVFDDRDGAGAPPVAIVNKAFAEHYLNGRDPVGEYINVNGEQVEVIGQTVTGRYRTLREPDMRFVYLPVRQSPGNPRYFRFAVRAAAPEDVKASILRSLRDALPGVIVQFRTMDEEIGATIGQERLLARLATIYGGLALLMAVTGIYGTHSYLVTRRRREIGIRLALGASQSDIRRLVLSGALRVLAVGAIVGIVATLSLGRVLESQLFGIGSRDPMTLLAAVILFSVCGVLASLLPARRAAKLDPVQELRAE